MTGHVGAEPDTLSLRKGLVIPIKPNKEECVCYERTVNPGLAGHPEFAQGNVFRQSRRAIEAGFWCPFMRFPI